MCHCRRKTTTGVESSCVSQSAKHAPPSLKVGAASTSTSSTADNQRWLGRLLLLPQSSFKIKVKHLVIHPARRSPDETGFGKLNGSGSEVQKFYNMFNELHKLTLVQNDASSPELLSIPGRLSRLNLWGGSLKEEVFLRALGRLKQLRV